MPEDIFERNRNQNTDDENYQVIAKFVSLLRSQETATDALQDSMSQWTKATSGDAPTATKVRTQFAEFTEKDAMRLVAEIAEETGQSKKYILQNLYSGIEYDTANNTIRKKIDIFDPDRDLDKYLVDPNSPEGILNRREDQLWNDARYVTKGEIFALSLATAASDEFALIDRDDAQEILDYYKDDDDFDGDSELTINWLNSFDNNYDNIQEYLATGRVRDESGNLSIDVPNYRENDTAASIEALINYDVANPSRINTGIAYIPQHGDTFTDRRKKMLDEKFQEFGWFDDQSVKENVERIFRNAGLEPGNRAKFKDADERHSRGYILRENIIKPLEDRLLESVNEPGSTAYANNAIEELMELAGTDLSTYNDMVAGYYSEITDAEWSTQGRTAQDKALDRILDMYGYKRSEFEEDQIAGFRDQVAGHDTFGDAMEDIGLGEQIDNFYSVNRMAEAEEEGRDTAETAASLRQAWNTEGSLTKLVKEAFRSQGLLGLASSIGYENYLDSKTIPDIVRRIANTGGVDDSEQLNRLVADLTKQENLGTPRGLPAYMVNEEDYTRQMGPNWDKRHLFKKDPSLTGAPPPIPGLAISQYQQGPAPALDTNLIGNKLQDIAYENPEFAKFIQQEMSLPGFGKDWEREGAEQFDEAAFKSSVFGDVGEVAYEQQKTRLDSFERQYEAILARNQKSIEDTGEGLPQGELDAAETRIANARQQYAREIGSGSGQDPLERKRLEEKGVKFTPSFLEQYAPMKEAKAKQAQLKAQIAALREKDVEYAELPGLAVIGKKDLEERQKRVAELAAIEAEIERLKGPAPIAITAEGEREERPGMRLDLEALTTIGFRDTERRRQTTPGMTSAEFFESRLPGFEARYKESPFFRLEQDRKQRLAEQETEQKQKDYETQRRRRLRTGDGRGRTIVTRGRR